MTLVKVQSVGRGFKSCSSTNVLYLNQCHLLYNLHSLQKVIHRRNRETTRRQIPRTHLRDVEKGDKNASKPVARHFNLPNQSKQHMVVCGLSLHQGSTESRKTLEQKFIFQIGTLNPHGNNSVYKPHTTHNSSTRSDEGLTLETSAFESLYGGQFTLSTQLIKPNYLARQSHII